MNNKEVEIFDVGDCIEGIFVDRPNRFVANIKINNEIFLCHVHDSGRIRELLYENNKVKIRKANNAENRKTLYDVISAKADDGEEILINSSLHRYISESILSNRKISPFGKIESLHPEVKYGKSRIDFLLKKKKDKNSEENIWVEVKGVSLSVDKTALFPDAPSERATKHLHELMKLKEAGDRSAVLLLVFRESDFFRPKYETDPKFSKTFYEAVKKGVEIYVVQCFMKNDKIYYRNKNIKILEEIK
ncbi:DNA/RNA nuclease SfsA [Fusobacterium sp. PH5-44]|uniref:DNA/RNA nuclease SfsA n=1 Tax=unclassified Fusobacterium TaxID=2648384 RepID=UPI003D24C6A9